MYGLLAILRLNFTQEEETYFPLLKAEPAGATGPAPTSKDSGSVRGLQSRWTRFRLSY
jgi:hypothetical protein